MRMIKPIVSIEKIADKYDTFVLGFNGVLTFGDGVKAETIGALAALKQAGKRLIIVSNSPWRLATIADYLQANRVPLEVFDNIVSAGELLHYRLKARADEFAAIGSKYFYVGDGFGLAAFAGLDHYERTEELEQADFIYFAGALRKEDGLEVYIPMLQKALALSMPLVCANNAKSVFVDGELALGAGAAAEQYALTGGKIITAGKPAPEILAYALEDFPVAKERVLMAGDNLATDIRAANLLGIDAALITRGVHKHYLGNGYIPDVSKARELSINFDAYPDYAISEFR